MKLSNFFKIDLQENKLLKNTFQYYGIEDDVLLDFILLIQLIGYL